MRNLVVRGCRTKVLGNTFNAHGGIDQSAFPGTLAPLGGFLVVKLYPSTGFEKFIQIISDAGIILICRFLESAVGLLITLLHSVALVVGHAQCIAVLFVSLKSCCATLLKLSFKFFSGSTAFISACCAVGRVCRNLFSQVSLPAACATIDGHIITIKMKSPVFILIIPSCEQCI